MRVLIKTLAAIVMVLAAPAQEPAPIVGVTVYVSRACSGAGQRGPIEHRLVLPPSYEGQTAVLLRMDPRPDEIVTDVWGRQTAIFRDEPLAAGASSVARWMYGFERRKMALDRPNVPLGSWSEIPEDVAGLYLANTSMYALDTEFMVERAREHRRMNRSLADVLTRVYDDVNATVTGGNIDGRWDPANVVLQTGQGSCSEYSYAFIGLCRAAGIPARYAGGVHLPSNEDGICLDELLHRWPEAYVPRVGWVPCDGSGPGRRGNFAQDPQRMFVITRGGDGEPESPVGWEYTSQLIGPGARHWRQGWSFRSVPGPVLRQTEAWLLARDAATSLEAKQTLLVQARQIGHPVLLPWLADLLYAPPLRDDAANVMVGMHARLASVCIADALGQAADAPGDERLVVLLRRLTGQDFGLDGRAWRRWLKDNIGPGHLLGG